MSTAPSPTASDPSAAEPQPDLEAAVEEIAAGTQDQAGFSLALSQDQKDIRDWVHGFAADVVRPAGH